jgi:LysR family transcriptional regulator, chromosome initiation inhibitor
MLDDPAIRAVAAVVRTGSFERAAEALAITPSAVSQRVRGLEERVGARLIVRASPCRATQAGEAVCRHAEATGLLERDLYAALPGLADRAGEIRPTISLAVNADSLASWFLPALAALPEESRGLYAISLDDEAHTAVKLEEGRVLAAVTSLERPVPGCRVVRLGAQRYCATASPGFMARHFAGGVTVEALAEAPALTFDARDRLQARWAAQTLGRAGPMPTHWLPSTEAFIEAARLGLGWGMNVQAMVRPLLEAGELVELVPGSPLDVPLYWQVARRVEGSLEELTRAVRQGARLSLVQE